MSQRSGAGSSAGGGSESNDGSPSANSNGSRRTGTATIKIAAKEASQREPSADPGPGDPLAAPSVAPEAVDIPAPPTPSQLVVKSASGGSAPASDLKSRSSRRITTMNEQKSTSAGPSASQAMQAQDSAGAGGSGGVHDETEEGEGEVEHEEPKTPETPSAETGGVEAPVSSGGGFAKASTRTSKSKSGLGEQSPTTASDASSKASTDDNAAGGGKKKRKKVTKFRYHKRITVRTKGHQNPSAIMEKVNLKDHNATLTTIDDLDPQELMRRAGIKGNDKTHWRVRLRQTKRCTKNGKTVTSTKVAYRDSEGNKKVETLKHCKNCGKKMEECKCGSSNSKQ